MEPAPKSAEEILRTVSEAVAGEWGHDFFQALVNYVAETLGVEYVLLGVLSRERPDAVETLAVHAKGQLIDNITYDLEGTPCANVMGQEICVYEQGVCDLFPKDTLLQQMGVESYAGLPLFDSQGAALGILVVLSSRPLHLSEPVWSTLKIFAVRAAAEIERMRKEETIQRALADLERAHADLKTFSFVASHHLQEPTRVMRVYAQKLSQELGNALPGEARTSMEFVLAAAQRSRDLVRDMVAYTQLGAEAGTVETVDMQAVVRAAWEGLGAEVRGSRARLQLDPLPHIEGRRGELIALLENLISNAITYRHPDREPVIDVSCRTADGWSEFRVADNGIGIDPADGETIFGVF